ncbi:TauD/TfdA family dioxygenase [Marinomonas dokdonensis]|uniref:TauD/TfdA family dioxygenase n=1 Tax=Marinomonas dokdonensis TaxID=328224 RepID=UPI0040558F57
MQQVEFSVNEEPPSISAHIAGAHYPLPALWLRERCQDPQHLDQITQQRLFDPHQLDESLSLTEVEQHSASKVRLSFSDGYQGDYDLSAFFADFDPWDGGPAPQAWQSTTDKSCFYFSSAELESEAGLMKALQAFLIYGVIIITDVPNEAEAILQVAEKFGHVRKTNFGKYFEVYTRPNSNDLAYRSVPLGAHTDNPYRDPTPGIQLLHCLANQTSGGFSTLVDSLSVVEKLKQEDPEGYQLLCDIPVRYRYKDDTVELIERRPIIQTDTSGRVEGVSYSPRLDYLPLLSEQQLVIFHRARKRLGQLFSDPQFEWRFKLEPGQLQMFHNARVLHGRTGFDSTEGIRHLQGAYIDLDEPKGRYKALKQSQTI